MSESSFPSRREVRARERAEAARAAEARQPAAQPPGPPPAEPPPGNEPPQIPMIPPAPPAAARPSAPETRPIEQLPQGAWTPAPRAPAREAAPIPSFDAVIAGTAATPLQQAPPLRPAPARDSLSFDDLFAPAETEASYGRPEAEHSRRDGGRRDVEPLGFGRGLVRTFGELCITFGLILLLFVGWQLVWTDFAADKENSNLAQGLTQNWDAAPPKAPTEDKGDSVGDAIVGPEPKLNTAFGIVYIPRFGDSYYRTLAQGTSLEPVLDTMGIGHHPDSAMPGEIGNFAVAGHRVTYGKPFNKIAELQPGDPIVVRTKEGYYTYTFRNFDIVLPTQVSILNPVPDVEKLSADDAKDRIMTLYGCNPMFSARERFVGFAEMTDWRPAADGPPASIAKSKAYTLSNKKGS